MIVGYLVFARCVLLVACLVVFLLVCLRACFVRLVVLRGCWLLCWRWDAGLLLFAVRLCWLLAVVVCCQLVVGAAGCSVVGLFIGVVFDCLRLFSGVGGRCWGDFGLCWGAVGRSLAHLVRSWAVSVHSWPLLGCSWSLLGWFWPFLVRSWVALGRSWAHLGRSWVHLGCS